MHISPAIQILTRKFIFSVLMDSSWSRYKFSLFNKPWQHLLADNKSWQTALQGSNPSTVFLRGRVAFLINKLLLKQGHAHFYAHFLWLPLFYNNSQGAVIEILWITHSKTFTIWPYTGSLLTPGWNQQSFASLQFDQWAIWAEVAEWFSSWVFLDSLMSLQSTGLLYISHGWCH